MLIEVGKFIFLADFVILEMEEDSKVPLILGRPFLHIADAVIRVKQKQLNLGVGTERMIFNIDSAIKHSYSNDDTCFSIDKELFFLPGIISSQVSQKKKTNFYPSLKSTRKLLPWKTTDILGICPSFYKYKIQLLDDKKPVVQKQRRLNPNMQEVVKKEIVKLLDTSIIYPIADSPWVSPIHCIPKKGGITVVTNENDELVPTRTVTVWKVCIDYCKLNEATAKDHFPLPFMDQMLERLTGNKYFCFLDSFSGYFQISIDPMDQEKTTFTCPFGTYSYRRMSFGLCNAPATFQSPKWNLPFELMCDASDFTVGVVLEFDIEIKDKEDTENVADDHLSRIDNNGTSDDSEVDDNFPGETLMEIYTRDEPWFTDFTNYLVGDIIPKRDNLPTKEQILL
ncbi:reverse transcriptase domain-containing protein [Tanacetum coccineum]|uniref:Reverse transcriptase domain-containing protein n=1 Tax=Tanacetum coccineum TaxID=301880 RepID=A0ABQ4ZCN7_9ASTR